MSASLALFVVDNGSKRQADYSKCHRVFITLQGLPTAIEFEGISFVTTLPAPMVTLLPMVTPGRMVTLPPIHTLSPMLTGSVHSLRLLRSTGSVL